MSGRSITDSGILYMEIYRIENRLFMIEVNEGFAFEKKNKMEENNTRVQD
jgi:L-rhamnose mutarotase